MVLQRMSFGFICPDVELQAVQRRPTIDEQVVIDAYRDRYKKAMERAPHGLHYIPFPGVEESIAVWLPLEEGGLLDEPSWEERAAERKIKGIAFPE